MRFQIGSIPVDEIFIPTSDWKLLEGQSVWGFQRQSAILGLISFSVVTLLWLAATPLLDVIKATTFPLPIHIIVLFFLGTILVHELIHAIIHPRLGLSSNTVIDFWPTKMFLCTLYFGPLSKVRQILVLIMPFVTLSLFPLLVSAAMQKAPLWLAYISVLNAFVSCGDMLATRIVSKKIPNSSMVRSKGWETYYKLPG